MTCFRMWGARLCVLGLALALTLFTAQSVAAQVAGTHVVQSGESLQQIANRYGLNWEELAALNGISDPNRIYAGQMLQLNGRRSGQGSVATSGQQEATYNTAAQSQSGSSHIVQAGDTLASIAQRYGVGVPAIVRANNLSRPPAIYPGQSLIIPAPGRSGSVAASQAVGTQQSWQAPEPQSPQQFNRGSAQAPGTPAAPTEVGKVIVISISQQHLWAFENGRVAIQTPVTTGRPGAGTPTGTFTVLAKYSPYRFISPFPPGHEFYYDPVDSNFSLRFTWEGHHIHDAPWRSDYGAGTNVEHRNSSGEWSTGSIGCVNVPGSAMANLYKWADEGIQVVVQP
jgi:LysM repeat protein